MASTSARAYERLRRSARTRRGRNAEPSAGNIDSQSVDGSETVGEDSFADRRARPGVAGSRPYVLLLRACGRLLRHGSPRQAGTLLCY
ncbi:hypothetical protein ACWD6R_13190 [Streptomyces sp. NPDC005151]